MCFFAEIRSLEKQRRSRVNASDTDCRPTTNAIYNDNSDKPGRRDPKRGFRAFASVVFWPSASSSFVVGGRSGAYHGVRRRHRRWRVGLLTGREAALESSELEFERAMALPVT